VALGETRPRNAKQRRRPDYGLVSGGPFENSLTAKGRELVAWRGFVDSHFYKTLDLLLTSLTGAEVRSM
jgi:hypothetical protein